MPLMAPGIGVVSGTDPVTVDILKFTGSFVSVSQSDDTMVVDIGPNFGVGGNQWPTFDLDSYQIGPIVVNHWGYGFATGSATIAYPTLVKTGSLPFYRGLIWQVAVTGTSTLPVRDDIYMTVNAIGLPTVEQFRYFASQSISSTFYPDTFSTSTMFAGFSGGYTGGRQYPPGPNGTPITPGGGWDGTGEYLDIFNPGGNISQYGWAFTTGSDITSYISDADISSLKLTWKLSQSIGTGWLVTDVPGSPPPAGSPLYNSSIVGIMKMDNRCRPWIDNSLSTNSQFLATRTPRDGIYFMMSGSGANYRVDMIMSSSLVYTTTNVVVAAPTCSIAITGGLVTMDVNGTTLTSSLSNFTADTGWTLGMGISIYADAPSGGAFGNLAARLAATITSDAFVKQTNYAYVGSTLSSSLQYAFWDAVTYSNNVFETSRVRSPGIYPSQSFP